MTTPAQYTGIMLSLPYPPSVNQYWRHPSKGPLAGRHLISEAGRKYREAVRAAVWEEIGTMQRPVFKTERLCIEIMTHAPDARRRDLDNILKGLLDGIAFAGLVADDSQFDSILLYRGETKKPAYVTVTIEAI